MAIPNGAMYLNVGVVKDSQLHFSVVNFNSHLTDHHCTKYDCKY